MVNLKLNRQINWTKGRHLYDLTGTLWQLSGKWQIACTFENHVSFLGTGTNTTKRSRVYHKIKTGSLCSINNFGWMSMLETAHSGSLVLPCCVLTADRESIKSVQATKWMKQFYPSDQFLFRPMNRHSVTSHLEWLLYILPSLWEAK